MLYLEVSPGVYAHVPDAVAQEGEAAVEAYVAANPSALVDGTDPAAPSAVVEAERAKLWHPAEVAAEIALSAGGIAPPPSPVVPPAPPVPDEE